jgi:hypothetical protein
MAAPVIRIDGRFDLILALDFIFTMAMSIFQAADVNSADTGNVYGAGAAAGIAIPLLK